jgi:hypothetical protein
VLDAIIDEVVARANQLRTGFIRAAAGPSRWH